MTTRKISFVICFAAGIFGLVQYFSPHPAISSVYRSLLDWVQIIFAFALLVGALSVLRMHAGKVMKRDRHWVYSAVAVASLIAMTAAGFAGGADRGSLFAWLFDNVQVPMQSTVFALLAFFVASAAYRGFRMRNLEAGILLVTALLIMLARIPIGELATDWLPRSADWVLNVPSMSAKRALLIGIGLGSVTTALRVILGIERSAIGG